MTVLKRRSVFERFFEKRSFLIQMYNNKDISKREFLEMNFDEIRRMQLKPFQKIDSFEKGMYNYQYYNSLAKYYKILAKELKPCKNYKMYRNNYLKRCEDFYHEKDVSAYKLMKFLNFDGVVAYYVDTKSKGLKNNLYEIVLENYKEAIFHSTSDWLLQKLKEEDIFINAKRKSLIAEYINEQY